MSIKISMNLFPVAASSANTVTAASAAALVAGAPVSDIVADAPVTCMVGAAPLEPASSYPEVALN